MVKKPSGPQSESLRTRAEKLLAAKGPDQKNFPLLEVQRLVHELQVHQTELDMQNQELRRAQEAIEEARYRYEALYDFAPVGYFTLNRQGKITQVNLTGAGLLGVKRSLLIDQPLHLWLAPEFREAFRTHLQKVFETGGQQTCELKILRHDGIHLHVLMESTTQPDAQEVRRQCHAIISDITARKQAEEELNLKERLLDGACDSIFLHDLDGHFLYLNEAAFKDRGYKKEELLAKDLRVLVVPEFAGVRASLLNDLLAKGEIIFESAHLRKDGSVMPVEIHARTINISDQQLILSVARDITERKVAEKEILRLASFPQLNPNPVLEVDNAGNITYANPAVEEFSRKLGLQDLKALLPTDLQEILKVSSEGTSEFYREVEVEGVAFAEHIHFVPQFQVARFFLVDITESRRTSEQIKNLNALLTAIKDMNETLLRAKSEPELFQHICDRMMEVPYNRFTWIGLVQPGSFEVNPVAWAGHEDGYLSVIKVTWDDSPQGRGPIGTAIKTGQPSIAGDIENDPKFSPWREPAHQRGYASCIAFPLIHEGNTLGVLNVYAEKKNAFRAEELGFLQQVAGDIALGVKSLRMEQEMVAGLIKMQVMMIQTIEAISAMAELRDPYTAGHQQRVTRLALALAQEIGLDSERTEGLRVASLIHDIGKIVVPAEILSRPGKLNDYEMNIIKAHSQAGHDILKKIDFPWHVAQIVLQHHERLNGSGYPQGLQGSDILQEAKILAVADVVEAMASHRPYRPALGVEAALEEITKSKDNLYDPEVVDACVKLFNEKGCSLLAQATEG
jgi:PAS domain S-box-containing protein/putative nucleotidyltransferase with HDIG domain